MSTTLTELSLPKLNLTNYTTWKITASAALRRQKLWKHVISSTKQDATIDGAPIMGGTESAKETSTDEELQDAADAICLMINPSIMPKFMKHFDNGRILWSVIVKEFEPSGIRQYIKMTRQLNNMTWGADETCSDYWSRMEIAQAQRDATGIKYSKDLHDVINLIDKVPDEFQSITKIWFHGDLSKLKFDQCFQDIREEEFRQTQAAKTKAITTGNALNT